MAAISLKPDNLRKLVICTVFRCRTLVAKPPIAIMEVRRGWRSLGILDHMDLLSTFERSVGLRLVRIHELLYKKTNSRICHRIPGIPPLLLHTTGARNGKDRTNTLTYARDGEDHLVVASVGGTPKAPAWYHNQKAKPHAEINVGGARLSVHARPVKPGDLDYARSWRIVNDANADHHKTYQSRTTRPIPVVVLAPLDRSPEAGRGSTVGA